MIPSRFLQIHTIHSYPAALLNRDEAGFGKRVKIGGSVRSRISSQCLKRHWRTAKDKHAIHAAPGAESAVRSRNVIERAVINPLRKTETASADALNAIEKELNKGVYGGTGDPDDNRQLLLLGMPEVRFLVDKARHIAESHPEDPIAAAEAAAAMFNGDKDSAANFAAFRKSANLPAGIEGALWGRMVTSDPAANIEAAVSVAHSFTTHAKTSESDYFSAVDDLRTGEDNMGVAHIGDTEIISGVYYGYVSVNVPGLVSNLEGCAERDWLDADRELAAQVMERLTMLIATVSPGAKLGSTAPYSRADLMLAEIGDLQPRSLANAYWSAIDPTPAAAARAMADHMRKLDAAYDVEESRMYMSVGDCDLPSAARGSLRQLAQWIGIAVRAGEAALN